MADHDKTFRTPDGDEFLLEKGAIDLIVDRREMRDKLVHILTLLQRLSAVA